VVHVNADGWRALLTEAQRDIIRNASIRVGAFIWESQKLPAAFDERLREVDAVWAPSSYCADIFRRAKDIPVDVVRYPVALREPRLHPTVIAETKEWLGLQREHKLILFAFDASSQLARKNPLALATAFKRTDLARAGWRLVFKAKLTSDDRQGTAALQAAVRACPGACLVDRPIGYDAMAALMDAADIYASPHSSEGFGLTIAEAMSIGKVVVATDYGGSRDLLDSDTGFPVRCSEWQISRNEGPYAKGTIWAKVDEAHLAECLVAAATLSDEERQNLGERARQRVLEVVSPDAIAREMRRSIENLLDTRAIF